MLFKFLLPNCQEENPLSTCIRIKSDEKLNMIIDAIFVSLGTIKKFLFWIKDNLLQERPELFIQGESV